MVTAEIVVAGPLEAVWELYDDWMSDPAKMMPPEMEMRTESADLPIGAGSLVASTSRGLFGRRMRYVARIVEHRPPHGVVFGQEARLVDEEEEGPFGYWRQEHEFEAMDGKSTRIVDRVTYRLPWGPIGWMGDWLVTRRRIREMFAYRGSILREILGASVNLGQLAGVDDHKRGISLARLAARGIIRASDGVA